MGSVPGPAHLGDLYEKSLDCVHCGLCLSTCPTYRETGRENSSPRGRIYLMRGVAEGRIPLSDTVVDEAFLCLGCRACETACPSGVQFGAMLEETRAEVENRGARRGAPVRLERIGLRVVANARVLHAAFSLLGLAQRFRLDRAVLPLLPRSLRAAHAMLPSVPPAADRAPLPEFTPAVGEVRGRVGFLSGCVMSELFGTVNRATLRVLAHNGFEVVVPREQGCCGALHAHGGDATRAQQLLRHNMRAFAGVDTIVVNSAGCGASMRGAQDWLPGEGAAYASKVRDVSEFLDAAGLRAPAGRIDARVCYDDPCHLVHGQQVAAAPRRLLEAIDGLELVAHRDAASCCGAAGIYNLTHPDMSAAVLDRKLDALAEADPDVIATGNPGCLMQIRGGVAKRGLRALVVHPVELLDEAYRAGHAG
ncbi:MAG: 4Fe-4S dicluster domain-containing protein [Myxococcales bacterium]|nr:4Fe-4S dicluster domain-containing protein [Myxococcales bacterium]